MTDVRTYPPGVPCWVETAQPDPPAACRFYGELLRWTCADGVASLDGQPVAGIRPGSSIAWTTYIAVADADAACQAVRFAGGSVVAEPADVGEDGRAATCADPQGAEFRLWQPARRHGAQIVNVAGAWNFSNLHTERPDEARAFYAAVFGWEVADVGGGAAMWRMPGYGDHLEATVDPDIRTRQASAPEGFADVVAGLAGLEAGETDPVWHVVFTVSDRDRSAETAQRLGAEVLASAETMWTRTARIRDPQGAGLTLSQFAPPDDWGE